MRSSRGRYWHSDGDAGYCVPLPQGTLCIGPGVRGGGYGALRDIILRIVGAFIGGIAGPSEPAADLAPEKPDALVPDYAEERGTCLT